MTVLTIPLDDKLADELKLESELVKTDESTVVRKALSNYLRQRRMDRIREEARPYFEATGFFIEDDIYREIS